MVKSTKGNQRILADIARRAFRRQRKQYALGAPSR